MTYKLFNKTTMSLSKPAYKTREDARQAKRNYSRPSNWRIAVMNSTSNGVAGWTR